MAVEAAKTLITIAAKPRVNEVDLSLAFSAMNRNRTNSIKLFSENVELEAKHYAEIDWNNIFSTTTTHSSVPEFDTWRLRVVSNWRFRVPFLIRLRDCTDGRIPSPNKFAELICGELEHPPVNWATDLLKNGRALVLLDGIDEVNGEFRFTEFLDGLRNLMDAYPKTYFLVSSRPEAVDESYLVKLGFQVARINPMSPRDRDLLIDRWHQAFAQCADRVGKARQQILDLAPKLKAHLSNKPRLSLLATNPLLCAMVCALHERDEENIPERELRLCESLTLMMLHDRDDKRKLNKVAAPTWYQLLDYDDKKLIVRQIAYHMMVNRQQSVIERTDAVELVREQLRVTNHQPPPNITAEEVLAMLMERSGMLREATPADETGSGTIDFIHNTFKEFLTAEQLVEEQKDGLLASYANKPEWLPVILFAAADTKRGFVGSLITKILDSEINYPPSNKRAKGNRKSSPEELKRRQLWLIALRCKSVAQGRDEELWKTLDGVAKILVPPRTRSDADALAAISAEDGGELLVPLLELKAEWKQDQVVCSIRALRQIDSELARKALRGYIEDKRLPVVNELSQGMNPLEIPAVRQMVQEPWNRQNYLDQERIRAEITDLSPLRDLTDIECLNLDGTNVTDLSPLVNMKKLKSLNISGSVSDLTPISCLIGLNVLDIAQTEIQDLKPLAGLTALRILILGGPVSDLAPLVALEALEELELCATKVTDLGAISGLRHLVRLDISWSKISDVGALVELKQLSKLDLTHTRVSDLRPLAGLSKLTVLNLTNTQVNDLTPLAGLSQLTELHLANTHVCDLTPLAGLSQLIELDLTNTKTSDLSSLSKLKRLCGLSIAGVPASDLSPLNGLTSLTTVIVTDSPHLKLPESLPSGVFISANAPVEIPF